MGRHAVVKPLAVAGVSDDSAVMKIFVPGFTVH